jgi:hypothetical protein
MTVTALLARDHGWPFRSANIAPPVEPTPPELEPTRWGMLQMQREGDKIAIAAFGAVRLTPETAIAIGRMLISAANEMMGELK